MLRLDMLAEVLREGLLSSLDLEQFAGTVFLSRADFFLKSCSCEASQELSLNASMQEGRPSEAASKKRSQDETGHPF